MAIDRNCPHCNQHVDLPMADWNTAICPFCTRHLARQPGAPPVTVRGLIDELMARAAEAKARGPFIGTKRHKMLVLAAREVSEITGVPLVVPAPRKEKDR